MPSGWIFVPRVEADTEGSLESEKLVDVPKAEGVVLVGSFVCDEKRLGLEVPEAIESVVSKV